LLISCVGKGGKNYKKGKKRDEGETRRDLLFKEDGQEYAQVLRMLGDGRLALQCFDNQARTGLIRGTMRRRVWINTGDIVLVGLREFQPEKADVIHKYTADEARSLQAYGELPANARINQTTVDMALDAGEEEEDLGFDFEQVIFYYVIFLRLLLFALFVVSYGSSFIFRYKLSFLEHLSLC
jgi:translation initiation factor 1A